MNNAQFAELLSEEDETAMQYLENLTVEEYEDVRSGYKITFVSRCTSLLISIGSIVIWARQSVVCNPMHFLTHSISDRTHTLRMRRYQRSTS